MASRLEMEFGRRAAAAGCPRDQAARFMAAMYAAQPKQLLFHAACRECDEPGGPTQVGFGGARGGAKSHAMLCQIAIDDCQREPGLKALLLRKVGRAAREGFEDLRVKALGALEHEWRRTEGVLTFANGSRIVLGHFKDESDVDAYLGLEYDVVGVEEATTLTLSKYLAIRTCNRTSKAGWRPRIYTTANPGGVGHGWYKAAFVRPWQAWRSGTEGSESAETCSRFVPATVDDNVFINPEYRATLDTLTGWQKRAWRYGDWDIAAGQFFTTFRAETHAVEPFPIPPNWTVWLAMDYGFTHNNAIVLLAQDGDGNIYAVDELVEHHWLPARHSQAATAMLARHSMGRERLAAFVAGRDCFAARPSDRGSVADQWAAEGWALDPADDDRVNGAAEALRCLGDVEAGIEPRLHIFRTCARLLECLPALVHDPHRPEDVLKWNSSEDGYGGDDPYDALRYGLMGCPGPRTADNVAEMLSAWRG